MLLLSWQLMFHIRKYKIGGFRKKYSQRGRWAKNILKGGGEPKKVENLWSKQTNEKKMSNKNL